MNKNILSKCIDELKKPTPRLDYVLGMLETLFELQGGDSIDRGIDRALNLTPSTFIPTPINTIQNEETTDLEKAYSGNPGKIGKI